ncbi:MAG: DUF975 family protein [Coriobacteriia bacterium]|nr:DUF975 family protein [Coriobacteriia bacterium]
MWTRRQLKEKGKTSFRANYWKAVLVAWILTIAMFGAATWNTGASSVGSAGSDGTEYTNGNSEVVVGDNGIVIHGNGSDVVLGEDGELSIRKGEDGQHSSIPDSTEDAESVDSAHVSLGADGLSVDVEGFDSDAPVHVEVNPDALPWVLTPAVLSGLFLVLLITFLLSLAVYAFVWNPLQAGCRGFFTANLNRPALVREAVSTFDRGYANCVKAMILRDVFTFLWTLLLIIPGIVKSYEYRMIPYLVADHPEMTYKEAFAESKRLMHGNKWKTFVLDLSFIGWWILSGLTLGLFGVFYVSPYYSSTAAALYEELAYGNQLPDFANEPIPAIPVPATAGPEPTPEPDPWRGAHASQQ